MSQERFDELKQIGWAKLSREQRKEYQDLKAGQISVEPTPSPAPKKTPSAEPREPLNLKTSQTAKPGLDAIIKSAHKRILDGNARAIILSYKQDPRPIPIILQEIESRLKEGEHKSVIQSFKAQL